ncbi:NAD(P)H-dependent oxidoreductase subunit E, partial [Actinospica sp. MGRD01-02]
MSADRGSDAFRALARRRGPVVGALTDELALERARTPDPPERWAPAVAGRLGLPRAAALGPASFYADLATARGRRHVRVCSGTGCFAATGGRHVGDVERELGVAAGDA